MYQLTEQLRASPRPQTEEKKAVVQQKLKITLPTFTHPQELADSKEPKQITRFLEELAKESSSLHDAYEDAWAVANITELSLQVLCRFANGCYQYWAQQLPSAETVSDADSLDNRLQLQWQAQAAGRRLFRQLQQKGGLRYFWAEGVSEQPSGAGISGVFYQCHPYFTPLSAAADAHTLIGVTELTDSQLHKNLKAQETAQQVLRRSERLFEHISCLEKLFIGHADEQRSIADYCLATLLYQCGYQQILPANPVQSATHYLYRLLGQQALQDWRSWHSESEKKTTNWQQQASTVLSSLPGFLEKKTLRYWRGASKPESKPPSLPQATVMLRDQIEQDLLQQGQQALFLLTQQQYQTKLNLLRTHWDWDTFRALFQQIFQLQREYPLVAAERKRELIHTLVEMFSSGDQDDDYRRHLRRQFARNNRGFIPSSESNPDTAIDKLRQEVIADIRQWHAVGQTTLAQALRKFYRNTLDNEIKQLTMRADNYIDPEEQQLRDRVKIALQRSLWDCTALASELAQSSKMPILPRTPESNWAEREKLLGGGYILAKKQILEEKPVAQIQDSNTLLAQKLMKHVCAEAEIQLGQPPCAFVLLGLGSYSRREMSFGSDFDIALLLADAKCQGHVYFRYFIDLMLHKTASFPEGLWPLERKGLAALKSGELWQGSVEELLTCCYLPDDKGLSEHAFPLRWAQALYPSRAFSREAESLWYTYQKQLVDFFQQRDEKGRPFYRLTEPWALHCKLTENDPLRSSMASTSSPRKTVQLKRITTPLQFAVLCWARYTGYLTDGSATLITDTRRLQSYLERSELIAPSFLKRLSVALTDLHSWRLRLHWEDLHYPHPPALPEGHVWLWPADETEQQMLGTQPRGFYLDAKETQRLTVHRHLVEEVILRSANAFMLYAQHAIKPAVSPLTPEDRERKYESSLRRTAFDPLNAALDVTLQKLNSKAARSTASDVQWLAKTVAMVGEELPIPRAKISDPDLVKTDLLVRQHWLLYWQLPLMWRGTYVRSLEADTPLRKVADILRSAPNQVGWRLRNVETELSVWRQMVRSLLASAPIAGAIPPDAQQDIKDHKAVWLQWIEDNELRCAPLKPEYQHFLFKHDDKKPLRWHPSNCSRSGNHKPYCLTDAKTLLPIVWVKPYPEQPSSEYLVTELDRRLGVYGIPSHQLMALHHAPMQWEDGTRTGQIITQSAVLLTAHAGNKKDSLHTILKERPQDLAKLDFVSFVKTLVRVFLTKPGDDKGDDYFLVMPPDSKRYQLVRIDNERAFFPANKLVPGKRPEQQELLVKSVIYCLDFMQQPWDQHPEIAHWLDELRQIQPSALVTDLCRGLGELHPLWKALFPESVVKQHALCQTPWISLPVLLVPEGLESSILKRTTSILIALRSLELSEINGMKLLEVTQPELIHRYKKAFEAYPLNPENPHVNTLQRFKQAVGEYYQHLPGSGSDRKQYVSPKNEPIKQAVRESDPRIPSFGENEEQLVSLQTGPASLSLQLSIPFPDLPETESDRSAYQTFATNVWEEKAHSFRQAEDQVKKWQHIQRKRVIEELQELKPTAAIQFSLLPVKEQQTVLLQLLPQNTTDKPLSEKSQLFLLDALCHAQSHQLDFRAFKTTLSQEKLTQILKENGQQVLSLNISGCTQLASTILKTIRQHCRNLKHLYLNQMPWLEKWVEVDCSNFPRLTRLRCENAAHMIRLTLRDLPQLKHLSIAGAESLIALEDGRLIPFPCHLPSLHRLNVMNCTHLERVSLRLDQPKSLRWLATGCKALSMNSIRLGLSSAQTRLSAVTMSQIWQLIKALASSPRIHDQSIHFWLDGLETMSIDPHPVPSLFHWFAYRCFPRITRKFEVERMEETWRKDKSLSIFMDAVTAVLEKKNHAINLSNKSGSLFSSGISLAHLEVLNLLLLTLPALDLVLESLDLNSNNLRDRGAQILAETLKTKPLLISLDLSGNKIGNLGAQALAGALKTKPPLLDNLNLASNEIGDLGVQALADALNTKPGLIHLNLSGNFFGKKSAQALAKACTSPSSASTKTNPPPSPRPGSTSLPKQKPDHSGQSTTGMVAPHAQLFTPTPSTSPLVVQKKIALQSRPEDEKTDPFAEIVALINKAYPDNQKKRQEYVKKLDYYRTRWPSLNLTDRADLQTLRQALENKITQRHPAVVFTP